LGFLVLDVATGICAALLGARVLATRPLRLSALLIAAILLCSICDVVLGRQDYQYWIPAAFHFALGPATAFFNLSRNVTTGLFMVLCFVLFAGKRSFPRWLLALLFVQVALEYPIRALLPDALTNNRFGTDAVPALLQAFFACTALYWTLARWRDDLSEARRRMRLMVSAVIALDLIVSDLLTRIVIDRDAIANYYAHEALIVSHLAILLFILFQLSKGSVDFLLSPAAAVAASVEPNKPMEPETARALVRLTKLLEEERVYRKAGLSLKDLSGRVGLPEYRLRRLIHEELGHQNFNAFLHQYRIAEACARLRDPAERRVPILTIALSVGYQSINTFNRGFREVMDVTPSAYRAGMDGDEPAASPEKVSPETA
jgi:AraC-like DNA-binding protein